MIARRIPRFISLVLAVAVLGGGLQAALAQDAATPPADPSGGAEVLFGVYPEGGHEGMFFEAAIAPGESHTFSLALRNAGAAPLSLLTYPADVYTMTNGGMGVSFQHQERSGATAWLDYPEGVIAIQPGAEVLVPFAVTVPEGTAPGQYVRAIGVETVDSYAVGTGEFRQVLRKVMPVAVTVPGEVSASFALGQPVLEIGTDATVLRVPVQNTGNIRVRPAGTIELRDASGGVLATGEVSMGSVYMGQSTHWELWLAAPLPDGLYTVVTTLADPDTGATASLDNAPVTIAGPSPTPSEPQVGPTSVPVPQVVTIRSAAVEPNADPIQYANVSLVLANAGPYIQRSRVTLVVSHNGEQVEELVLDDNLPLPAGETTVETRYIPPAGFAPGTWTFGIVVHAIDPNATVETLLLTAPGIASIEIP